ncbi:MAG: D-alanine--D-alanine ligase [Candidatus Adiutrix sp.]|jgi:D-alanine-D-alanine ligase|nr:D-alanine--D-alanine ligase [Candidatus Adiutrix sp.]
MSGKKIRVALVMGGRSKEREVSLASGSEVLAHIDRDRFEVVVYDPADDLVRLAEDAPKIDLAFLTLHGPLGEDGAMQGFCEMLGLPYIGSGIMASAMAMDKATSKRIYRDSGLPVAPDLVLHRSSAENLAETSKVCLYSLGSPLVVKPLRQGSSVGLSIVDTEKDLSQALSAVFALEGSALLEKYLPGREFTCAVVGNAELTALPPIEIIPAEGHRFFDYQAKYEPGQSQEICPAKVSARLLDEIQQLAVAAHEALACRGLSRSDMIYSDGQVLLLETNTIPGLTSGSLVPKMARAYGLNFTSFISYMIDLALTPGDVDLNSYKS